MENGIYIIGTNHTDLKGEERLGRALSEISPDVIALEFHKDLDYTLNETRRYGSEKDRQELCDIVQDCGLNLSDDQINNLFKSIKISSSASGYEARVAYKHTKSNPQVRLEYIDISPFEEMGREEFIGGITTALKSSLAGFVIDRGFNDFFASLLNNGPQAYLNLIQNSADGTYKNTEWMQGVAEIMNDNVSLDDLGEEIPEEALRALKNVFNPKRDDEMARRISELYSEGNNRVAAIAGLAHTPGLISRLEKYNPIVRTLLDFDSN